MAGPWGKYVQPSKSVPAGPWAKYSKSPLPDEQPKMVPSYDALGNPTGFEEAPAATSDMPYLDQISNAGKAIGGAADFAVRQAASGMTFGLADRAAGLADYATGNAPSAYEGMLAQQKRTEEETNKYPAAAYPIQIGAGIPVFNALQKAGLTLAPLMKGKNLPTQMGLMATEAAGYGAAYGAGTSQKDTVGGVASDAYDSAKGAASFGALLPPVAKGVGWLFGGGAKQAALANRPSYEQMVGERAGSLTQEQYQSALDLMLSAKQSGITLTVDEALNAVSSGATKLGDLRKLTELTEAGQKFQNVMAERPNQMANAVSSELDKISPPVSRPYDVAPNVQKIGEDVLSNAEKLRTQAVDPYFKAAESDIINPNAIRAVEKRIDQIAAKDTTGVLSDVANEFRDVITSKKGVPAKTAQRIEKQLPKGKIYTTIPAEAAKPSKLATDVENLNRARQFMRDKIEFKPFDMKPIPKEQRANIQAVLNILKARMEKGSENFRVGNQLYQDITKNKIEPLKNSPIGQLADASTPEAQRSILFNKNPLPNSDSGVANAIQSIKARDPELAKALIRQEAERVANSTVKSLDSKAQPDQYGGDKFAKAFLDNPQYAENFRKMMGVIGSDTKSFDRLLKVLQATGNKPGTGSDTAYKLSGKNDLERSGIKGVVDAFITPLKSAGEAFDRARLGDQTGQLADLLLSGEQGVRRVQELAAQGDETARKILKIADAVTNTGKFIIRSDALNRNDR